MKSARECPGAGFFIGADMQIILTGPNDAPLFENLHEDVFDAPPQPDLLHSYLADPRLHMAVAVFDGQVVGMITGMHYHHPDKPPQMWINELGVAEPFRRRGIATDLIQRLSEHALTLACTEIWVVADPTDMAEGFYTSLGWERTGQRLAMFSAGLASP
ncbi:GNAT family N-acetyltransferase [Gymnodinialimonas hymeniacidonis]|uniref:GNAT family N-acetyltransferase n=1 Tax=Gymnodinialimonas hymeniacidonis TaxID=3126508 RepID=UPI0034C6421C